MKHAVLRGVGLMLVVGSLLPLALTGCGSSVNTETAQAAESNKRPAAASPVLDESGKGMAAMREAAAAGKYLFLFVSNTDDDQTLAMRKVFDATMPKVADRAQWIAVNVSDSSEKAIVAKFDLGRAPMPLVLAIAPNGAVTGGFPQKFDEKELLGAFVCPAMQKVLRHLQNRRLVFVCVQNGKTKSNDAALQGVRDFKADERFESATEIVMLDPADPAEAPFLIDMKIDPKTEEAMTIFLAPPGSAIAQYKGATDKEELATTLEKAGSGCAGGSCGPEGCGPK
jgi:hypothetical protein